MLGDEVQNEPLNGEKEPKISLVGAELPCEHSGCEKSALSQSVLCWDHIEYEDKEYYRRQVEDWATMGVQLERFYLRGVDFSGLRLMGAILEEADLRGANLQKADLRKANLQKADLMGANLEKADLRGANLQKVTLLGAILEKADLGGAKLQKADLMGAFLEKADLRGAKLQKANLVGANLHGAYMRHAYLRDVRGLTAGQIAPAIGEEEVGFFSSAKETYLGLKNYFHSVGRYEDERWAFLKEKCMEKKEFFKDAFSPRGLLSEIPGGKKARRLRRLQNARRYLFSEAANLLCGYGEEPWKVLISAVVVVSLFAAAYFLNGNVSLVSGIYGPAPRLSLGGSFYFSVVTFTTLGLGDLRPDPASLIRYAVMAEAFIGAFMMALFVFTFGKSVARG